MFQEVLDGVEIAALIDSASDLTLMRADEYVKRGSPRFKPNKTTFRGVGSKEVTTLGRFEAEITVDDYPYPICICVISDTTIPYPLLIGTDFLNKVEVSIKAADTTIKPIETVEGTVDDDPSKIFKIDVIDTKLDEAAVDISHINDDNLRTEVRELILTITQFKKRKRLM